LPEGCTGTTDNLFLEGTEGSGDLDGFDFFSFDSSNSLERSNSKSRQNKQHAIRTDIISSRTGLLPGSPPLQQPAQDLSEVDFRDVQLDVALQDEILNDGVSSAVDLTRQRRRSAATDLASASAMPEVERVRQARNRNRKRETNKDEDIILGNTVDVLPETTTTAYKMLDTVQPKMMMAAILSVVVLVVIIVAFVACSCYCRSRGKAGESSGCDLSGNNPNSTASSRGQNGDPRRRWHSARPPAHSVVMNYLRENRS